MNNHPGYVQLKEKSTGKVMSQKVGREADIEHFRKNVWFVQKEFEVVHTMDPDVVQPPKFFRAINMHTEVTIYATLEPIGTQEPVWVGQASELDNEIPACAGDEWQAFLDNKLIGTSEL